MNSFAAEEEKFNPFHLIITLVLEELPLELANKVLARALDDDDVTRKTLEFKSITGGDVVAFNFKLIVDIWGSEMSILKNTKKTFKNVWRPISGFSEGRLYIHLGCRFNSMVDYCDPPLGVDEDLWNIDQEDEEVGHALAIVWLRNKNIAYIIDPHIFSTLYKDDQLLETVSCFLRELDTGFKDTKFQIFGQMFQNKDPEQVNFLIVQTSQPWCKLFRVLLAAWILKNEKKDIITVFSKFMKQTPQFRALQALMWITMAHKQFKIDLEDADEDWLQIPCREALLWEISKNLALRIWWTSHTQLPFTTDNEFKEIFQEVWLIVNEE